MTNVYLANGIFGPDGFVILLPILIIFGALCLFLSLATKAVTSLVQSATALYEIVRALHRLHEEQVKIREAVQRIALQTGEQKS